MVTFLNKNKKIIFTVTVVVFVVAIFFGMGAIIGNISLGNAVAKVGSGRIPYERYQMQVRMAYDNIMKKQDLSENQDVVEKMVRQEVFKEMVVEELLYQEAKKMKMGVSNFEVALEIENTPMFFNNGRFDPRLYVSSIWTNYRMGPKEYEDWRKKERTAMKFKHFLYTEIKISPDDIKFYWDIMGSKSKELLKDKEKFVSQLKQEKFLDIANYYLRFLTTRVEIKDYRQKFERNAQS